MDLISLKKKHGKLFCVSLNNLEIIFRLPSWKDYKAYILLLQRRVVPKIHIYDSIFKDIVLDEVIIDHMYMYPAGIVDSIVDVALTLSGNALQEESDVERLNADISNARQLVQSNILDQLISVICQAFPAYTPDKLDEMDWPEILRLLLISESILLREGKLQEPIAITPFQKEQSLADKVLNDAAEADKHEGKMPIRGRPKQVRFESDQVSPEKAKQLKMIEMLKERRSRQ